MRLKFKILLVDDDYDDNTKKRGIEKIYAMLSSLIEAKGFEPEIIIRSNIESIESDHKTRRTDLFISDNNLGGRSGNDIKTGIDFYFQLTNDFICDFILYTSSDKKEIVSKIINKLDETQNPNIFSRFTFITRESGYEWFDSIAEVIDHILSKREEINNLRGFYAEIMSRIHNHLKNMTKSNGDLESTIELAFTKKMINSKLRSFLHTQRSTRNGLLHNNEEFCNVKKEYRIMYTHNSKDHYIYEAEFQTKRIQLKEVYSEVMLLS
ncbi:hypothetical protein FS594_20840 [Rahnella aquatilis]|nr:hypothetical protein FS594_20840 [Rahnella aquatilis]